MLREETKMENKKMIKDIESAVVNLSGNVCAIIIQNYGAKAGEMVDGFAELMQEGRD